jgi:hypothetical protein
MAISYRQYLFVFVGSIFLSLWEAYRVIFFFSMFPQASYVEGTSLTTSLRYQASRLIV